MTTALKVGRVRLDDVLFHPHNVRRDLGDLRGLAASIQRFGITQPVVVEEYGEKLRLRAGHRRCAAARLAGLERVPAVIHAEPLEDDEWLMASLAENRQRRGLDEEEMRRTARRLLELGCTREGIAEACSVSPATVAGWLRPTPKRPAAQPVDASGRKPRHDVTAAMLRQFVDGWAERDGATVGDVLDGLEQLLAGEALQVAMPTGWTPPKQAPTRLGTGVGTKLDLEKLEQLHREGRSAAQIGDQLGVTSRTVVRALGVLRATSGSAEGAA